MIEDRNEESILIGDMNKLVGNGPLGVKDNNVKVTFGGKLVHQLLQDGKYILLNNSDKCAGGPFTRIDPSNPNIKSCLSLVIVSAGLEDYVEELLIDKERKFTPHRPIRKDGKLVFTDHYGLLLKFKNIPLQNKSIKEIKNPAMWNTNKVGGWKRYLELTTGSKELEQVVLQSNPEQMMGELDRRLEKIKFQSFGKVTKTFKSLTHDKELTKLYKEKDTEGCDEEKINRLINNKLHEKQLQTYEKKLEDLKKLKKEKGKSAAVFKLKDKIVGSKKIAQEAVSMKDPESGELIIENEKLKEASAKYVSNLLTNRIPLEEFRDEFHSMEFLHEIRMNNNSDSKSTITKNDYQNFLKQIAKKSKEKYQFILKAGQSLHDALYALYKRVWESGRKPSIWENTTCIQLFKGKGRSDEFKNQRYIHMKEEIPKGFEYIVMDKVKPTMMKNCTKFQIGAIPGHQAAEHLYTIKSVMALFQLAGLALILTCFDLKKYFDSENLKDAMNSLFHYGVKGKEYNLIYELNKQNRIQIKTSVGMTERFVTGPTVSQGSIGGGLISAINLDYSVNRFFFNSSKEVYYHDVRLQPIIYQDDLGRFSSSRMDAQAGNDKIEACMETKLLDLHQDKSCYILIGNKKVTGNLATELALCPLTLYGKAMKRKEHEKYLGDCIHELGVAASAEATVKQRCARMFSAHTEIRAIVEDCRSTTLGGLRVGIDIWETAYIPSLLNNSSTWMEIEQSTIDKLDDLQNSLYRSLLDVPYTTPKAALIWEVGGVGMKYRIMQYKLIFMNHILHLDENSLAKEIQSAQERHNAGGLTQEIKELISHLSLPNCFAEKIPQGRWKNIVKTAISKANEKDIRASAEQYKKMKIADDEKLVVRSTSPIYR